MRMLHGGEEMIGPAMYAVLPATGSQLHGRLETAFERKE